jgi:HAD superfamily hydrolase (TIGR01509 family)
VSDIRGVILDVDGTLIDSNDAHARAWVEALAEFGYAVPYEKVRPLIGMGGDKLMPAVGGPSEESAEGKQITQRRAEIFKQRYLPTLKAFPVTRELLEHMRARGLKRAVASSAKQDELEPLLKLAGADDLIEKKTSSDDADSSKPDPDIVQVALEKLGLPPEQVVMIGDTPFDVEAAGKAGIGTIALRCGGWHDHDLVGALAVYQDPADLLARYDSSPLG